MNFFLIFLILDASLILFFFWKTVKGYFFLKSIINWESAKGKIIFQEQKKIMNKLYYYLVLEFKTNNYKTISFKSGKIKENTFKPDAPVEIFYNPFEPNKAVVKGYENVKFKEGLNGTIALTILNASLAMLFLLLKS